MLLFCLLVAGAVPAAAQTTFASITGTITDPITDPYSRP